MAALGDEAQKKTRFLNPEYLLFAPAEKAEKPVPLLIYLHGAGGTGTAIRKLGGQAGQVWKGIVQFKKGPCYMVAPQCTKGGREGGGWQPEDLNVLLSYLKASLKIDEKRIYLTGNSMGGYGTWAWGGHSPEHFAAVAPVSGGIGPGGPKDLTPRLTDWAAKLATVPVYAFAGGKDRVVPAANSQRMIDAIRKAGGEEAKIKIFPEEGHNARRLVFTSAEFFDWLFSKKRD